MAIPPGHHHDLQVGKTREQAQRDDIHANAESAAQHQHHGTHGVEPEHGSCFRRRRRILEARHQRHARDV
jgi:hypothetical protein